MKKHDYIIAKFYNSLLKIFEQFLHDIVFAQNQRDNLNKLFRVVNYNYNDINFFLIKSSIISFYIVVVARMCFRIEKNEKNILNFSRIEC